MKKALLGFTTIVMVMTLAAPASSQTAGASYTITPTAGPAGTVINFSGTGCRPDPWGEEADPDGVFVFVTRPSGNFSGQLQAPFESEPDGSFSGSIRVPSTASPGNYPTGLSCSDGTDDAVGWPNDPGYAPFTVDDCVVRSQDVASGGPHRVSMDLPAGRAVVTFFGVSPGGAFTLKECSARELGEGIFAHYDLTAEFSFSRAEVCLPYDEEAARRAGLRESEIELIHQGDDGREVVTTRRDADANFVCGVVTSFSPFYLGAGAIGRSIELACPPGRVPPAGFEDVSSSLTPTHFAAIECLAWWEITRGLDAQNTRYGPKESVSRGQMATFMARVIDKSGGSLPATSQDWFSDDDGSVHENAINRMRQAGVVSGTSATTFAPARPVTRDQMATFLRNTFNARTGVEWSAQMDYFTDDDGNVHEPAINAAAAAGVARGTDGLTAYTPSGNVTREQMATFITRTLDILVEEGHTNPPT